MLGLTTALLVSGAVVTETVFGLPGVGSLVVSAVLRRDYPVIQGALLVIAAIYVLINLLIDLLYLLVDPRVRPLTWPLFDFPQARLRPLAGAAPAGVAQDRARQPDRAVRRWWRRPAGALDRALRSLRAVHHEPPEGARRRRTGSAPTTSAATCSAAWSTAAACR